MEDTAMLVFYLPIIIFEAMLESQADKRKKDEPPLNECLNPAKARLPHKFFNQNPPAK
jgi:hypothetical protein